MRKSVGLIALACMTVAACVDTPSGSRAAGGGAGTAGAHGGAGGGGAGAGGTGGNQLARPATLGEWMADEALWEAVPQTEQWRPNCQVDRPLIYPAPLSLRWEACGDGCRQLDVSGLLERRALPSLVSYAGSVALSTFTPIRHQDGIYGLKLLIDLLDGEVRDGFRYKDNGPGETAACAAAGSRSGTADMIMAVLSDGRRLRSGSVATEAGRVWSHEFERDSAVCVPLGLAGGRFALDCFGAIASIELATGGRRIESTGKVHGSSGDVRVTWVEDHASGGYVLRRLTDEGAATAVVQLDERACLVAPDTDDSVSLFWGSDAAGTSSCWHAANLLHTNEVSASGVPARSTSYELEPFIFDERAVRSGDYSAAHINFLDGNSIQAAGIAVVRSSDGGAWLLRLDPAEDIPHGTLALDADALYFGIRDRDRHDSSLERIIRIDLAQLESHATALTQRER